MTLHPDHHADLMKSGLSDEMIKRAKIYTVPPGDISKRLGASYLDESHFVESAMAIPYLNDGGFERFKIWPGHKNKDGHSVRYIQPKGSGVHLYVPPGVEEKLTDTTLTFTITEGEKKALKAAQEGLLCVGLGGIWNWKESGSDDPIKDLDRLATFERSIDIVPDSDFNSKPGVLLAVYRLGKQLEKRGAKVQIVCVPPGPDKVGLDDFLVSHTIKDYESLKRIRLDHEIFKKNKCAEADKPTATVQPFDLDKILSGQTLHPLRPGQDYIEGKLTYGIRLGKQCFFVRSDRISASWEQMQTQYEILDADFCRSRFSREGIRRYLKEGANVSGPDLFAALRDYFRRFIVYRAPDMPALLAVWTMATYCYQMFQWFGYLHLNSPTPRCGKSSLLDLIRGVAFNASGASVGESSATLFREASANGATQCLDEMDQLGNKNKETKGDVIAVLNGGFQKDRVVNRCEGGNGKKIVPREFHVYSPKALAGIEELADTITDRCFSIVLWKKTKAEKPDRFNHREWRPKLVQLRDDLHIFGLLNAAAIEKAYESPELMDIPEEADDRLRGIMEPLFAIALVVDQEAADANHTVLNTMKRITLQQAALRADQEEDTQSIPQLVQVLIDQPIEGDTLYIKGKDLLPKFTETPGLEWINSTNRLGTLMRKIGLRSAPNRIPGTSGVVKCYRVTKANLQDLNERYLKHSDNLAVTSVTNDVLPSERQEKDQRLQPSLVTGKKLPIQEDLLQSEKPENVTYVTDQNTTEGQIHPNVAKVLGVVGGRVRP